MQRRQDNQKHLNDLHILFPQETQAERLWRRMEHPRFVKCGTTPVVYDTLTEPVGEWDSSPYPNQQQEQRKEMYYLPLSPGQTIRQYTGDESRAANTTTTAKESR